MRLWVLTCALLVSAQPVFSGDFSGRYVGGGLAVGTSDERVFPWYDKSDMDSPSAFAFAGFNFTYGDFVYGPEFSLRANLAPQTIGASTYGGGYSSSRATYRETIAPTISFRAGAVAADNLLLYGRAGVGASRIRWTGEERTPASYDRDTDHINWFTLSSAVGAEYNFDRLFVRVEAEVRRLSYQNDINMIEYQASTALGVRF